MVIEQAELDALLERRKSETPSVPHAPRTDRPDRPARAAEADAVFGNAGPQPARQPFENSAEPSKPENNNLARILRLRVPLIVRLAHRQMTVGNVRRLSVGTIVEFSKPIHEPLDLMVRNHPIGHGDAVKVGENYGLRLMAIRDPAARVRSLGR